MVKARHDAGHSHIILQDNLKRFPMALIQMCKYLSDEEGGVLMLCVQSGDAYNPDIHVFQCIMTPVS